VLVSWRILPFVLFSVLLLSGCWETQCLTGPDAAGRACYEEQRAKEECEQQRAKREQDESPDYERY
jgi:hypothetical protein